MKPRRDDKSGMWNDLGTMSRYTRHGRHVGKAAILGHWHGNRMHRDIRRTCVDPSRKHGYGSRGKEHKGWHERDRDRGVEGWMGCAMWAGRIPRPRPRRALHLGILFVGRTRRWRPLLSKLRGATP